MTRRALIWIALAALFVAGAFLLFRRQTDHSTTQSTPPTPAATRATGNPASPASTGSSSPFQSAPTVTVTRQPVSPERAIIAEITKGGIRLLPGAGEIAGNLNSAAHPPTADLEILENALSTYRRVFGQNPPGSENAEITAALTGLNQRQLAVLPPDHSALNATGELTDRWGVPYFFHPVTRTTMEILSAGPDRKLWTSDDIGGLNPALVPPGEAP